MGQAAATLKLGNLEVLVQSARAGVEAQLTNRLGEFISGTRRTLDGAIYDLRSDAVLADLQALVRRGQKLRLAVDGGPQRTGAQNGADPKPSGMQTQLGAHGLTRSVRLIPEAGKHLMHHKFLVRDGEWLWTGSANFTQGGLELQDNNCLIVHSAQLAERYQAVFDVLWRRGNKPVPSPANSVTVDGIRFWPLFEPGTDVEHIESLLVPYLNHANAVRVLAFEMTDPGILAALQRFKGSGSDIRGVLDGFAYSATLGKTVAKQPELFWFLKDKRFVRAPSHPFTKGREQDFMHNKTLILDGTTVITGSYNLSEHAETNAENMLVIESTQIARFYLDYFDALFAKYQKRQAASI